MAETLLSLKTTHPSLLPVRTIMILYMAVRDIPYSTVI